MALQWWHYRTLFDIALMALSNSVWHCINGTIAHGIAIMAISHMTTMAPSHRVIAHQAHLVINCGLDTASSRWLDIDRCCSTQSRCDRTVKCTIYIIMFVLCSRHVYRRAITWQNKKVLSMQHNMFTNISNNKGNSSVASQKGSIWLVLKSSKSCRGCYSEWPC